MTTPNKYYVMVPSTYSYNGKPYWQELRGVRTLTSAKRYVDEVFGGLKTAEIAESVNDGPEKVVAKKNKEGQWVVIS